jgi:transaldolase
MSMRASIPIFSAFQLAAAGALIGWCVVSVYEGRQLDQCSQDINRQIQYNQARLNTIQMRRASLHARAAETAKTPTQKKGG